MKNVSKLSVWFGVSIVWSILFISLASYSAQKAIQADPEIENKLGQHLSEKLGKNVNISFSSDFSHEEKKEWIIKAANQKLNIESITGDIEISTVPSIDSIKIIATGQLDKKKSKELLNITESNDFISIKQPDNGATQNLTIKIEVPISHNSEFEIGSVSGDVSINSFKLQKVLIKTISGDISIADLESKSVTMKTVSGDVALDNVLATELEAKTTSGDVLIELPISQNDINFDIKTVSGSVNNNMTVDKFTREYRVSTISGDVEVR